MAVLANAANLHKGAVRIEWTEAMLKKCEGFRCYRRWCSSPTQGSSDGPIRFRDHRFVSHWPMDQKIPYPAPEFEISSSVYDGFRGIYCPFIHMMGLSNRREAATVYERALGIEGATSPEAVLCVTCYTGNRDLKSQLSIEHQRQGLNGGYWNVTGVPNVFCAGCGEAGGRLT